MRLAGMTRDPSMPARTRDMGAWMDAVEKVVLSTTLAATDVGHLSPVSQVPVETLSQVGRTTELSWRGHGRTFVG
jgi:hypothetical protein